MVGLLASMWKGHEETEYYSLINMCGTPDPHSSMHESQTAMLSERNRTQAAHCMILLTRNSRKGKAIATDLVA